MNMEENANGSHRNSSRVLKPPGGGHTDLFGPAEVKVNAPRPKYNQQNSSNLNAVVNSEDPNEQLRKLKAEKEKPFAFGGGQGATENGAKQTNGGGAQGQSQEQQTAGRARVPPGGYSSGFW